MAAFAGLIDFDREDLGLETLARAAAEFPDRAYGDAVFSSGSCFAFVMRPLRAAFAPPVFERPVDDGRFVVVGDSRVDDRATLLGELADARLTPQSGDAEILLAAIARWNAGFAAHLTGDFALAAWDREERRLLLARDQLGARPFYYARRGFRLAFASSTLALRRLLDFDPKPDIASVADYIVLGEIARPGATFLADVFALPPAHMARVTPAGFAISRYRDYPVQTQAVRTGREEIREELMRLLRLAVRDRLRSNRVSIELSGGMDSSSLAVVILDEIEESGGSLSGLTMSHEGLFHDDEPRLAREIGTFAGFPVTVVGVDAWKLWEGMDGPDGLLREKPGWGPLPASWREIIEFHAAHGSILFNGDGGDYVFVSERQPLVWWGRHGGLPAIVGALGAALLAGIPLRTGLRARRPLKVPAHPVPIWLDRDLVRDSAIIERSGEGDLDEWPGRQLPRPRMRAILPLGRNDQVFELCHPTVTGVAVSYALPWLDRRLVEAALSWAPYPWIEGKFILREAMAGRLPPRVVTRRKQGLAGDSLATLVRSGLYREPPVGPADLDGICDLQLLMDTPPQTDPAIMGPWCRAVETAIWRRTLK